MWWDHGTVSSYGCMAAFDGTVGRLKLDLSALYPQSKMEAYSFCNSLKFKRGIGFFVNKVALAGQNLLHQTEFDYLSII